MIKKTITYTDYFDTERTEDFYFNLTKAELFEMEMGTDGGLEHYLQRISQEQDRDKLFQYFKKVILSAYGEKSDDGKRFVKSEELSQAFCQNPAYDILMMEFFNDPEYAAEFISAIMPKDLQEKVAELQTKQGNRQTVAPVK